MENRLRANWMARAGIYALAGTALFIGLNGAYGNSGIRERTAKSGIENVVNNQEAKPQESKNSLIAYARYTANFEGRKPEVYDPNPKDNKLEPTIGVGHYLDRGDSRGVFKKVLPEVDYDAVYNKRQELTNEQIDRLFAADLPKYVDKARNLFPKFDTYPEYLRQALVDGCYRGDLSGSPKTRRLINKGEFRKAAQEYINRGDYRNAEKNRMPGIRIRMDTNRRAMEKYAEELESRK